jgi:hypothetical protein
VNVDGTWKIKKQTIAVVGTVKYGADQAKV